MSDGTAVLRAQGVSKTFQEGKLEVAVLHDINLAVQPGEKIAIVGSSGSGKTTLLHLLGGLDRPSSGEVYVRDKAFSSLGESERGRVRNQVIGFVYQFHHLLPEFTALENVALPLLIRGTAPAQAAAAAREMLAQVKLDHRLQHKPGELSGGERQRTAIARALVTGPQVVLADEPTGNLDHKTAERVFDLMLELHQARNTSIIVVTHDPNIAARMTTTLTIEDGRIRRD